MFSTESPALASMLGTYVMVRINRYPNTQPIRRGMDGYSDIWLGVLASKSDSGITLTNAKRLPGNWRCLKGITISSAALYGIHAEVFGKPTILRAPVPSVTIEGACEMLVVSPEAKACFGALPTE